MPRGAARVVPALVGLALLALGTGVTRSWRPGPVQTVYNGSYVPLHDVQLTQAYAEPVPTSLRAVAYPGWPALALAVVLVLLVLVAPLRPLPTAAVAAAAAVVALAATPGWSTPLGGALLRLAVVLVPALAAVAVRRLVLGSWPWRPAPGSS